MARTVDSDIAVINGATCNGQVTSGCQLSLLPLRTGGWPSYLGPDPAVAAMYVPDKVDGAVSVIPLPSRPHRQGPAANRSASAIGISGDGSKIREGKGNHENATN